MEKDFYRLLGKRTEYSVTAIITTHNRADLLPRAINSVFDQIYEDLDLIVVDDASTDTTQNYMQVLSDKYEWITYIRISPDETKGANYARNVGIEAAKGKLVAFLDDDDEWLPEKTTLQVEYFKHNPEVQAIGSDWIEIFVIDRKEYRCRERYSFKYGKNEYIIAPYMRHTCSMMMYKTVPETVGGFRVGLPEMHETEFQYRICEHFKVGYLSVPTLKCYHYIEGEHISSNVDKYLEALETIKELYADKIAQFTPEQQSRWKFKLVGDEAYRNLFIGNKKRYREIEKKRLKECGKWEKLKFVLSYFVGIKTILKLFVLKNNIQEFIRYKNHQ